VLSSSYVALSFSEVPKPGARVAPSSHNWDHNITSLMFSTT
jgi:hypothetical protein